MVPKNIISNGLSHLLFNDSYCLSSSSVFHNLPQESRITEVLSREEISSGSSIDGATTVAHIHSTGFINTLVCTNVWWPFLGIVIHSIFRHVFNHHQFLLHTQHPEANFGSVHFQGQKSGVAATSRGSIWPLLDEQYIPSVLSVPANDRQSA